ncbi:chemotaxis protein CheW [Aquirhabdus sp.]|uniref:chemotaxis protein CheW n=1 Tax=Aquirhabdus sp. TaxID=2824160 RepID=UPI00396C930F
MAAKGFIQLLRLSEKGRRRIQQDQESQSDRWSGVAFMLAGQRFVAPLGEVAEVLRVPDYSPVHGVQRWLLGLANVRGRLLPLTDLAGFTGVTARDSLQSKVMVIDHGDLFSGLIVDEVLGIQHFSKASYETEVTDVAVGVSPYVQGGFFRTGQHWHVFMLSRLAADPRFLSASL